MGFIEVKRYHIICDNISCENVFVTIDERDEDDEDIVLEWEVEHPIYTPPLIDELQHAGWKFIDGQLFCFDCKYITSEESLFVFLKADMGII